MSKMFKQAIQMSLGLALVLSAAQAAQAGRNPGSVRPPSTIVPVRPPSFSFIPARGAAAGGAVTSSFSGARFTIASRSSSSRSFGIPIRAAGPSRR